LGEHTSKGRGKGKWLFSKVDGREERGEGNPPKVNESRINTAREMGHFWWRPISLRCKV